MDPSAQVPEDSLRETNMATLSTHRPMLTARAGRLSKPSALEAVAGWDRVGIVAALATAPHQEVVPLVVRTAPARDEVDMVHRVVEGMVHHRAALATARHQEATPGE